MIGAIFVRAVGDGNREAIGVPIRPDQMVRSGFRGGVRTARIVEGRLDKESHFSERAVDFVGADVMEPYILPRTPEMACCFENIKCAADVRLYEIPRPNNGTVHMAFGGKVDDCSYVVFTQHILDVFVIAMSPRSKI